MELGNLLSKYEGLKFEQTGLLFDLDLRVATEQGKCPYCGHKLYLMRNRPLYFCKSFKHANRFVISADKVKIR